MALLEFTFTRSPSQKKRRPTRAQLMSLNCIVEKLEESSRVSMSLVSNLCAGLRTQTQARTTKKERLLIGTLSLLVDILTCKFASGI
jgi:hypothetical protein